MINISPEDILSPTFNDRAAAEKAARLVNASVCARYVAGRFDIKIIPRGIALAGTDLVLSGNAIKKHLEGAQSCYLICATLGAGIDRLIERLNISDISTAIYADYAANIAIESYCDEICGELEETERSNGLNVTLRFSHGYADLPLEQQPEVLKVLNAEKIGVACADTMLMSPMKTVTAIVGAGKDVKKIRRGCAECTNFENCLKRNCND